MIRCQKLNRNADDVGQAPDTRLRTANPNWHPLDARIGDAPYVPTPSVQEFLDEFGVVMLDKLNGLKGMRIRDNVPREQRLASQRLYSNKDMVFLEADKARGIASQDVETYRAEGRAELALTYSIVDPEDFDCLTIEDLEEAVIKDVRKKLTAVLKKHSSLIDSWKGTCLNWKYKYLQAAVNRHPQQRTKYRVPYARFSPKLEKPGSRMIVASHQWIGQPFALMIAIEMQPQISKIPTFLKDADTLVRDVEQLRLTNDAFFIAMDVTKLYPSIDLEDCIEKMAAYQAEQWTDEHDPAAMESDDLNRELTEVILYNQYVLFDNTMWKAWRHGEASRSERHLVESSLKCICIC